MGDILGVGMTHFPLLIHTDAPMTRFLDWALEQEVVPAEMKDPANWPAPMQAEWADRQARAVEHRARHTDAFRRLRTEIDSFHPDVVLIWGDDQYENFREAGVPPFCVYIFDEQVCTPFASPGGFMGPRPNVWGEPADKALVVKGHPEAAKYLTAKLLESDIDVAYAYQAAHPKGLAHAHTNTIVYLDIDHQGFDYPVIPFQVNCYGRGVISQRGGPRYLHVGVEPDPPAPSPRRCFAVGRAVARALRDSPYRSVLIGSASWSHAFLVDKHCWLYPDVEADQARFRELASGRFDRWAELSLAEIEEAGQQEFLNWICLAGAMTELGYGAPEVIDYLETYIFNSDKAFAIFRG